MSMLSDRKQRVLAVAMLMVVALASVVWLLLVRPQRQQVRDGLDAMAQKHKSLRQRGWTLDRTELERVLSERLRVLDGDGRGEPGLKLRGEQVRQHATAMFRERITSEFQSPEAFVRNASNIDFREALNGLQRRLAEEGIWVAPDILNLAEDTSVPYTYQLLLQVWTLERLMDLVLENHLQVVTDPTVRVRTGGGERAAARIALQPVVAYYLEEGAPLPWLLGIPVRLRLSGQLAEARAFVLSLTAAGNFLPPISVEVYAADPRTQRGGSPESAESASVELDITCSAFFAFPGGDAPARAPAAGGGGAGDSSAPGGA